MKNLDDILSNKLIQVVLKQMINEKSFLYDKLPVFVKNWVFDEQKFKDFLYRLDDGLNKGIFLFSYKDLPNLDYDLKEALEKNHLTLKIFEFLQNISDHLNQAMLATGKTILDDKDKLIAKAGIEKYIFSAVSDLKTASTLLKLLSNY